MYGRSLAYHKSQLKSYNTSDSDVESLPPHTAYSVDLLDYPCKIQSKSNVSNDVDFKPYFLNVNLS